jgi:hypothetical protein
MLPIPCVVPASRLLSYQRGGDISEPSLRLLLTDDGRVITVRGDGDLVQRKLTASGTAALLLQALQLGFFERDADFGRVALPGTTPPARGATVLIIVVANGSRDVRVSFVPTGQPDDDLYERSITRDKLTRLAQGYEDLSSLPAGYWAEARPQPYQVAFHRLFVLPQPSVAPAAGSPEADAVWPFITPMESVGDPVAGAATAAAWRCAVLHDAEARGFSQALTRAGAISGYEWGSRVATATLAWRGGTGTLRLQISPFLPHEPVTCAGAPPPL